MCCSAALLLLLPHQRLHSLLLLLVLLRTVSSSSTGGTSTNYATRQQGLQITAILAEHSCSTAQQAAWRGQLRADTW
jgi:hypothetical protein